MAHRVLGRAVHGRGIDHRSACRKEGASKPRKCGRRRHAAINGSDAASETVIQSTPLLPGREGRALVSFASSHDPSGRVRPPRCTRVVVHLSRPLSTPFSASYRPSRLAYADPEIADFRAAVLQVRIQMGLPTIRASKKEQRAVTPRTAGR